MEFCYHNISKIRYILFIFQNKNSTLCNEREICLFLRWGKCFQDESHTILFSTSPMVSVFFVPVGRFRNYVFRSCRAEGKHWFASGGVDIYILWKKLIPPNFGFSLQVRLYYCDQIERWILLLLLKSLLIVPNLFRVLRSNPRPPRYTYANEFSNHQNTWQSPPSE